MSESHMCRACPSVIAIIAMQLAACASPDVHLTEARRAAIRDTVEHVWAEMMAGAGVLDPARIRAGYAAKPTVAINGVILADFDAQFELTRHWLGSLTRLEATYDNVHLEVIAPDAVVAAMNHHLRWTDTTGGDGEWHSAWTAVFRRNDGQWKITYAHESVALPERR